MPIPVSTSRRVVFGVFQADLHTGELRKHGIPIRLQSQPFQILAMLLDRPGELVTREEICQKLWSSDTFVDFDHSLGTAINKIREVLNDSASAPRFVETLPRRGYRFISEVTAIDPRPLPKDPSPASVPAEQAKPGRSRSVYAVFGVSAAVALLAATLIAWNSGNLWQRLSPSTPITSIAVLPLLNLSNNPDQQFFADGMTDELITKLAQINSLRVISRTSAMAYMGTRKPAAQIARELGVDALVEGSVLRSGNQVRITAQLIHASSDRHLWARSYDRDLSDVLTVQGEVAREIADSISLRLTPQEKTELSRSHPVNPDVALLYFKGSYFLSKLDAEQAKNIFTEAIHLDPNSAESWAGLADALHTLGVQGDFDAFPQAREAANKALAIDTSQAQALMVLGVVSFLYDWNPSASEAFFRRSLAARPGYAMAHALFANTLAHRRRFDEAIEQTKLASASDPVSVLSNSMAWHTYYCARRYDDALRIVLSSVELDPTSGSNNWRLARTWERKGEFLKAIAAISPEDGATLRAALAQGGERGYWQRRLELLFQERRGNPQDRRGFSEIARVSMHLGEREAALRWLEKGYTSHDPFLIFWLPIYPEFDELRNEPRFQKMLHGMGS